MKMHFGPRILINNTKKEEVSIMKKLETYPMPPVILTETETEMEVADWYEKHRTKKLTTQVKHTGLQYFSAPPVILVEEEEK